MIVTCPACKARFQYDEARFQGVRQKRFRCPKCGEVFEVVNPDLPTQEPLPVTAVHRLPIPSAPFAPGPSDPFAPGPSVPFAPGPSVPEVEPSFHAPPVAPAGVRDTLMGSATVKQPGVPRGMRFTLAFLTGPRASTVRVLDTPVTVIGREEGDIITQDPESSRRHAQVEIFSDGTVWLTDLGSTNGTFVEGSRIDGALQLQDRQEFTCGKSTFMLLLRHEDEHTME